MKINSKILDFDAKRNIDVVVVHHYIADRLARVEPIQIYELSITVRELEKELGISVNKIRRAIDRLEQAGIIEVLKGGSKKANAYKYIQG